MFCVHVEAAEPFLLVESFTSSTSLFCLFIFPTVTCQLLRDRCIIANDIVDFLVSWFSLIFFCSALWALKVRAHVCPSLRCVQWSLLPSPLLLLLSFWNASPSVQEPPASTFPHRSFVPYFSPSACTMS